MGNLPATDICEETSACSFFYCVPASCGGETAQADLPLATRAFEETLDGIMPMVIVFLLYAALSWFEVCVLTLQNRMPHYPYISHISEQFDTNHLCKTWLLQLKASLIFYSILWIKRLIL